MFSSNIRTLYLYVVSFLALMAIVFATVNLVEKITNYIYPVDYSYDMQYNAYDLKKDNTAQDINTNMTTQQQNAQRSTLKEIFTSLAIILISVPLYNYHWIMAQKERKKEEV